MLKVLIADDEIKICKLIIYLVPWKELDLEVIGTVYDGKSALDEIKKLHPDILITDIRMPECDGLELVKLAKSINPEISCIIISGHSDFNYALQAIQSDVDDYLLKPIKKDELIASLKKVINKNNMIAQANMQKENLIKITESENNRIKKFVLSNILTKSSQVENIDEFFEDANNMINDFNKTYFQTLAIQPVFTAKNDLAKIRSFFYSKIESVAPLIFESFSTVITYTYRGAVYCVLNDDECKFSHVAVRAGRIRKEIMALGSSSNDVVTVASNIHEGPNGFVQSILEAKAVIAERYFDKTLDIILLKDDYRSIKDVTANFIAEIDKIYRKAIIYALKKKNTPSFIIIINEIKMKIMSSNQLKGSILQSTYQYLVELFINTIKKEAPNVDTSEINNILMRYYYYSSDIDFLFVCFLESIEGYNSPEVPNISNFIEPVLQAKEYVSLHYADPISLEDIGMKVKLNPAYFSSLFKKETEMNFMDYVNNIRIENAKVFIKQTNKNLEEISSSVGFNDPKYFSKRFKKSTGLSPNEYRKLYS